MGHYEVLVKFVDSFQYCLDLDDINVRLHQHLHVFWAHVKLKSRVNPKIFTGARNVPSKCCRRT
jgi:hypothetical protein